MEQHKDQHRQKCKSANREPLDRLHLLDYDYTWAWSGSDQWSSNRPSKTNLMDHIINSWDSSGAMDQNHRVRWMRIDPLLNAATFRHRLLCCSLRRAFKLRWWQDSDAQGNGSIGAPCTREWFDGSIMVCSEVQPRPSVTNRMLVSLRGGGVN
jgi:hypothetical protein